MTFEKLLHTEDGKLYLPVTHIEDYPDFKERGLFLTTHMARNWHDHARLAEQLAPLGAVPTYDGYVAEIQ